MITCFSQNDSDCAKTAPAMAYTQSNRRNRGECGVITSPMIDLVSGFATEKRIDLSSRVGEIMASPRDQTVGAER